MAKCPGEQNMVNMDNLITKVTKRQLLKTIYAIRNLYPGIGNDLMHMVECEYEQYNKASKRPWFENSAERLDELKLEFNTNVMNYIMRARKDAKDSASAFIKDLNNIQ